MTFSRASRLDLHLMLRRSGWRPWLAAAFVGAAALVQIFGTGKLRAALDVQLAERARLHAAASAPRAARPEAPPPASRFAEFAAVLGNKRELNHYVAIIFNQAGRQRIALAQAEYKLDSIKPGGFHAYRVTLPVRGAYPQLRRFVDATLQDLPHAALEEVSFKRDGIADAATEAKLRFVIYLKDTPS